MQRYRQADDVQHGRWRQNADLSAKVLEEIGYAYAIFPSLTGLTAAAAMEQALRTLKETGSSVETTVPLFDFKEFCSLIGFDDVYAFERRWARDTTDAA